ncbi:hypothetical protein NQ317_003542 [Molorchus minor]|uniref:Uncharacterized protein n=1 Tax=Molorchus minor TaxID=1323400 RepID=A0ABQ9K1A0_9CUCU|nr:hypothetical protein NQ317_003542 [Molorchus minor]
MQAEELEDDLGKDSAEFFSADMTFTNERETTSPDLKEGANAGRTQFSLTGRCSNYLILDGNNT